MGRLDRTIRVAVWALVMGWPAVACGWGRIGHDAVAYIAECNLSPKAQRIAEKYLGHSIVYFSSWMDDYRPLARLRAYDILAYGAGRRAYVLYGRGAQLPGRCRLRTGERHRAVEELRIRLDDSTVAANLRYVIHLVGDMHCPAHVDYPGVELWYDVSFNGKSAATIAYGIRESSRRAGNGIMSSGSSSWTVVRDGRNARSWPARRATGFTRRRSSAATFMRWLLQGASSGAILSMPLLPVSNVRFSGPDIVWPKC